MYPTIDYKEAGAIYALIIMVFLYALYALFQPWIDLFTAGTIYVKTNITDIRIFVYILASIPALGFALPLIYYWMKREKLNLFLFFGFMHFFDYVITEQNYLIQLTITILTGLFQWLFQAV